MRTRPRLIPRGLHLLCLAWLLVVPATRVLGGTFQVEEEPAQNPTAATVRQHLQAEGYLRVWTTVLSELFRLPTNVTVTLTSCGRIDAFYSPAQRRIYLCDELLTYFARVFAPPDGNATAVRDATLFTFFHVVGHALIQVLDLSMTGPDEQAADEIGAVFLVVGNAADEQMVLAGSQFLFQRSRVPEPPQAVPFWALHPWTTQRYVHLRCLLYGSNPARYTTLLEGGGLNATQAQQCPDLWQRQQQRWHTLLAPHLSSPASAPDAPPPVATLQVVSPEQSLHTYYDAINHRQYARTWLMLAPQFKQTHFCCEDDGSYQFPRYRSWWERVASVEILDTHVQEHQSDAVVVQATVRYTMYSGQVTEERHRFRLVMEPATQRWLIAEQTRGVLRPRGP